VKDIETWFDKQGDKITYENISEFKLLIKLLPDGRYINIIRKVENIRSLEQNNAMWGIPYKYFEAALVEGGTFKDPSKKMVHEWCMVHCLPPDYKQRILDEWLKVEPIINFKTSETYKEPFRLTTTKMHKSDAVHYYENMQMLYAESFSTGFENDMIPDPTKDWKKQKQ
jgi:hypothetical protein